MNMSLNATFNDYDVKNTKNGSIYLSSNIIHLPIPQIIQDNSNIVNQLTISTPIRPFLSSFLLSVQLSYQKVIKGSTFSSEENNQVDDKNKRQPTRAQTVRCFRISLVKIG